MTENETFLDPKNIKQMVNKAKRRSLVKQILISLGVFIIIVPLIFIGLKQLLNISYTNLSRDIDMTQNITRPNTRLIAEPTFGFLEGEVEYKGYKVIEGVPVAWGKEEYRYGLFNYSRNHLENSFSVDSKPGSHKYQIDTMQREMQFYHPSGTYNDYINDIPLLNNLENSVAEMAVSFDKPYSTEEIKGMLPANIKPVWFWVDTYEKPDSLDVPEQSNFVYGFNAEPGYIELGDGTEKDFIIAVENGIDLSKNFKSEYERIYDHLKKDKEKPTAVDVKIIGVVVTGDTNALKQLKDKPYAKANVLGAVVKKP